MHGGRWLGKFPTLAVNEAISISRLRLLASRPFLDRDPLTRFSR
jgi:hypothetical protein